MKKLTTVLIIITAIGGYTLPLLAVTPIPAFIFIGGLLGLTAIPIIKLFTDRP